MDHLRVRTSEKRRFWTKFSFFLLFLFPIVTSVFAIDDLPKSEEMGLPFEGSSYSTTPTKSVVAIIKESIKYVGLLAILALSWGGIQFLISYGADEKVKVAKRTIIYSLVGVLLSVTAYTIIDIVNSLTV